MRNPVFFQDGVGFYIVGYMVIAVKEDKVYLTKSTVKAIGKIIGNGEHVKTHFDRITIKDDLHHVHINLSLRGVAKVNVIENLTGLTATELIWRYTNAVSEALAAFGAVGFEPLPFAMSTSS